MRRMLDPKELGGGGGSTSPTRHGYRIVANDSFHYIVYTTKNYNFKVGDQPKLIEDFETNKEYEELRAVGYYEAGGVVKRGNNELVINYLQISGPDSYFAYGYNLSTHDHGTSLITFSKRQIAKLF